MGAARDPRLRLGSPDVGIARNASGSVLHDLRDALAGRGPGGRCRKQETEGFKRATDMGADWGLQVAFQSLSVSCLLGRFEFASGFIEG